MFDVFVGALASALIMWAISVNQQSLAIPEDSFASVTIGLQLRIVVADDVTLKLYATHEQAGEHLFRLEPIEGCRALLEQARVCARRAANQSGIAYYFSAPYVSPGTWSYRISYYEPSPSNPLLRTTKIQELAHLGARGELHVCGRDDVALGESFPAGSCAAVVERQWQGFVPTRFPQ
jgi:hypothetical protein